MYWTQVMENFRQIAEVGGFVTLLAFLVLCGLKVVAALDDEPVDATKGLHKYWRRVLYVLLALAALLIFLPPHNGGCP